MTKKTRNEEARDFLQALFGDDLPEGTALELRVARGGSVTRTLHASLEEVKADAFTEKDRVWFGAGLRRPMSAHGDKSSVALLTSLWADLDGGREADLPRIRRILPPSVVVDSGGGLHLYWLLAEPVRVLGADQIAWAEEVMYGLAKALGADEAACDVARVMGLPGTYNPGNGKTRIYDPPRLRQVLHLDTGLRYDLPDLTRWRRPRGGKPVIMNGAPAAVDVDSLRVTDRIKALIRTGWSKESGYPSRSEADAAVILAMLAAGHTEDEIVQVFRQYPIGEKVWQKGRDGARYLRLTIDRMRSHLLYGTGAPGEVRAHDGVMQVCRTDGSWQRLTDHVITPVCRFEGEDSGFEVEVDGRKLRLYTWDFSSASAFRKQINAVTTWYGDDKDVQRLLSWLAKETNRVVRAVRALGWHGRYVIFPNAQLDPDGTLLEVPDYIYTGTMSDSRLLDCEDWDEKWRRFVDLFMACHDQHVCAAILGWYLATFAAPQLRSFEAQQFPLLCVWGPRGGGKTGLIQETLAVVAGNARAFSSEITRWAFVQHLGSSNTAPVVLDEHRNDIRAQQLYSIARSAYNAQYETRGRPDLRAVVVRLTAPIVYCGEAPYNDPALLDRTVVVSVDPKARNEGAYYRLHQEVPLDRLNAGIYRTVQRANIEEVWEKAGKLVPRGKLTARQHHAWRVVASGLIMLGLDELVPLALRAPRGDVDPHPQYDGVVGETLRAIVELIRARRIREGQDYVVKGDETLWVLNSTVLPAVEEYYRKFPSDIPLTRDVIRSHLKAAAGGEVVEAANAQFRLNSKSAGVWGTAFNLAGVERVYGIPREVFLYVEA